MHHSLNGELIINNKIINFDNGNGYIEGDKGRNFPKNYLWLNAINKEASITLAIATIPLGLITITGIACLIEYNNKEYRFGTYNNAKVLIKERNHIVIKKSKYLLDISIGGFDGHKLKAPVKGNMIRYIKENINVHTSYKLYYKDDELLSVDDPLSSLEYMY